MVSLDFVLTSHKLNNRTIKDGYSLPRIEDALGCLHGAIWLSTLDLESGKRQMKLKG